MVRIAAARHSRGRTPRRIANGRASSAFALRGLSVEDVDGRVAARIEARKSKDFARSDALRAELEAMGVSLHDSPDGTTWTIAV